MGRRSLFIFLAVLPARLAHAAAAAGEPSPEWVFARDGFTAGRGGAPTALVAGTAAVLSNNLLACRWENPGRADGRLEIRGGASSLTLAPFELFQIVRTNGAVVRASEFSVAAPLRSLSRRGEPKAARYADRLSAEAVALALQHDGLGLRARWRATLTEGAHYLVQTVALEPLAGDVPLRELILWDGPVPGARVAGRVDGSPVRADPFLLGVEDPASRCVVTTNCLRGTVRLVAPLRAGSHFVRSSAVVLTAPGQTRRAFQAYVERERVHPYRPFLHYNSWYDIAWPGHLMDEAMCLEVIDAFGRKLVTERGVPLASFVFDDGWDRFESLWGFHDGFPRGFVPLRDRAAPLGAGVGVWMSPWGGYGDPQRRRVEWGRTQGFETRGGGYSLAGPRYRERFTTTCQDFIRAQGCNYFKFDGIGGGAYASGASDDVLPDLAALTDLAAQLHRERPDVFVNCTVGTWPSPYWLWGADSIWRQGEDIGFADAGGTMRDRWITYRDGQVYRRIVGRAPLFPLNAVMLHGIALARLGTPTRMNQDVEAFAREVRTFFASGTGLQELYLSHSLLTDAHWDILAEAARWARERQDVLVDSHWIGGDPNRGEVYGFAAWSPARAILALRNPKDEPQAFALDPGTALELPAGQPSDWILRRPWSSETNRPALALRAGAASNLLLRPLDVAVWDATPGAGSPPFAGPGASAAPGGVAPRREDYAGRWAYAWEGRPYVREFLADGSARLLIGGQPYGGWNGFRWEFADGEIEILRPDGQSDGRQRLRDRDTLEFVDDLYPAARRVPPP